jgi:hypothetical protein
MAEVPARDFAAWRAWYDLEPWGEERADLSRAVGHAIADSHRLKKKPQPYGAYMPFWREPEPKRQPPADTSLGKKILGAIAAAWNKARGKKQAKPQAKPRKKGRGRK